MPKKYLMKFYLYNLENKLVDSTRETSFSKARRKFNMTHSGKFVIKWETSPFDYSQEYKERVRNVSLGNKLKKEKLCQV